MRAHRRHERVCAGGLQQLDALDEVVGGNEGRGGLDQAEDVVVRVRAHEVQDRGLGRGRRRRRLRRAPVHLGATPLSNLADLGLWQRRGRA